MENGIWRFASATSRHPVEPGKYSAVGIWWIRDPGIGQNRSQTGAAVGERGPHGVGLDRRQGVRCGQAVIEPLRAAGKTAAIPPKSTARNRATSTVTSTRRGI
jgi:hypothetical protein